MLRKLAVFITCAGLTLSPLSAQALGFGGIKLSSSLNEKLSAEVALLSASENDIQSLKIKLASDEAFSRAGIARNAFLHSLEFKVKQNSSGDYFIHITTNETVREPFLDFLLDINWKNGRMLREYTMLIDPPGRAPKQASSSAPIIAATVEPEPEPAPVIQAAPIEAEPAVELVPDVTEAPTPTTVEPEIVATPAVNDTAAEVTPSTENIPAAFEPYSAFVDESPGELWPRIPLSPYSDENDFSNVKAKTTGDLGNLDYGLTKANDNLWEIAEKLRQGNKNISIYQVMMALLKNNPDAFIANNVHRLKVGHVLRIEDASSLTALSRKEAANAYIKQTNAWNNSRKQTAGAASVQAIIADNTKKEISETTATSGELTLSSPNGEHLNSGGGGNEETLNNDLATMRDQLRQSKADASTNRTRNIELNEKLQLLEDELNRLQRSISVKDDELAALQHKLAGTETTTAAAKDVKEEPAVQAVPAVIEPVVEKMAEPIKPTKSPVEIAAEISKREVAAAEPGMMDMLLGVGSSIAAIATGIFAGGSLLIIAPIVLFLLVVIGIIIIKRRRQGDKFQESILTGVATADSSDTAAADSSTFSEESSFLSDFAMSGAGEIETDDSEVDPLTEADVFIAYGRYEAAEERLNEAVLNEPERMDLRAKMLELHHATQNKDAFESGAEEFYASLGENKEENPLWKKIAEMGAEISPENPLFAQDEVPEKMFEMNVSDAIAEPAAATMSDSEVMDIGLKTGVFETADLDSADNHETDLDMDFDLDLDNDIEAFSAEESALDEEEMNFNLDSDVNETKEDKPEADISLGSTKDNTNDDNSLDFNLDMGADDVMSTQELEAEPDMTATVLTDDNALDFNFDMGDAVTAESTMEQNIKEPVSIDDNDFDLNLDMGDSLDEELSLDMNLDDELVSSDEVGTKLDLAKAYIDMGDPEGARSILSEVMDEGSSTQKEEAQELLGQIV
jgi:pilus assembly protein FimV